MSLSNHKSTSVKFDVLHRGYYMAMQRYEISPRVLKNIFQHEKRNFVSPSNHLIFFSTSARLINHKGLTACKNTAS